MPQLHAGRLRHRVTIERRITTQDSNGDVVVEWEPLVENEPAAIEPLSVRDFIASQAVQSEITTRITIRHRAGLTSDMRIRHGDTIYNPQGWLADPDSGLEYLTAPCTQGANEG